MKLKIHEKEKKLVLVAFEPLDTVIRALSNLLIYDRFVLFLLYSFVPFSLVPKVLQQVARTFGKIVTRARKMITTIRNYDSPMLQSYRARVAIDELGH